MHPTEKKEMDPERKKNLLLAIETCKIRMDRFGGFSYTRNDKGKLVIPLMGEEKKICCSEFVVVVISKKKNKSHPPKLMS